MNVILYESNFMIEFSSLKQVPKNFNGKCLIISDKSIRSYKDGALHNEFDPAVININGIKQWYLNGLRHRIGGPAVEEMWTHKYYIHGLLHREDGPAIENASHDRGMFMFRGKDYGLFDENKREYKTLSIEEWKEKVKELKREEELKIFK